MSYDESRVILDIFFFIRLILIINKDIWWMVILTFSVTCVSHHLLRSFKHIYRQRPVFFSYHGRINICTLLVFLLLFSSFCCYCYFFLLDWVLATSKKHTTILVYVLCVDRRIFFFDEVRRKEKEIGLSFSLHPPSFFFAYCGLLLISYIQYTTETNTGTFFRKINQPEN